MWSALELQLSAHAQLKNRASEMYGGMYECPGGDYAVASPFISVSLVDSYAAQARNGAVMAVRLKVVPQFSGLLVSWARVPRRWIHH